MGSVCNSITIACHSFRTGAIFDFFHSDGNSPFLMQDLKIISKGLHNELPHILVIRILILSRPCDLFGFKFGNILKISS